MATGENNHFMDKLYGALRKAATELEELQVKLDLGKAEAKDKFDEFNQRLDAFLAKHDEKIEASAEKLAELNNYLDPLRVMFEEGRQKTGDELKEQKAKIEAKIDETIAKIKSDEKLKTYYAMLLLELESMKLQLFFMNSNLAAGTEAAKEAFDRGKFEFNKFVEDVNSKIDQAKEEGRFGHFQEEISQAFGHFKKAFSKP